MPLDQTGLAYQSVKELAASDALASTDLFITIDPTTFAITKATGTQMADFLEGGAFDPLTITSTNASAVAVGANGATNPVLKVNANTASVATGVEIIGAAAASGVAVAAISSGTNENMTVDAKGSGTITLGSVSTGNVIVSRTLSTVDQVQTSTSANALAVGANGTTNPVLKINANTASVATGIEVIGAAAAGGVAVKAISSGTNENLTIDAKGSGTVTIAGTSTGAVTITPATTITGVLTATGGITSVAGSQLYSGTAVPAGGTTGSGLKMSSTSNLGIFFGSGVPTLSAAQGSLYIRTDGSSTSTRMYINTNGSTTWTNVTTAA